MNSLRRDLRCIYADGVAASLMVGVGEIYLPAFVLVLTANHLASGLAATLPMLTGAALQLYGPRLLERFASYRRWVVFCALVQAGAFVPLVVAAMLGAMPLAAVYLTIAVYWAAGMAGGAAWSTWVDTLVPRSIHANYFARRNRAGQIGMVVGFAAGGVLLQLGSRYQDPLTFFAVLFGVAGLSRLVSGGLLAAQGEHSPPRPTAMPAWQELLADCRQNSGRTLLYLLGVQAAVQISGPYFTPYMLAKLELSYLQYMVLICAAYVAKIAFLPMLGRIAERYGPHRLLWLGGAAIAPIAALWCVSDSMAYLLAVQIFSGAAWAAHELAMLLIFIDNIPPARRLGILTLFNFANATVFFAGSALGGLLLSVGGADKSAYMALFLASSLARAAVLAWFALKPAPAPVAAPRSQQSQTTAPTPATSPVLQPAVVASVSQGALAASAVALPGGAATVPVTAHSAPAVPSTAAVPASLMSDSIAQSTSAAA